VGGGGGGRAGGKVEGYSARAGRAVPHGISMGETAVVVAGGVERVGDLPSLRVGARGGTLHAQGERADGHRAELAVRALRKTRVDGREEPRGLLGHAEARQLEGERQQLRAHRRVRQGQLRGQLHARAQHGIRACEPGVPQSGAVPGTACVRAVLGLWLGYNRPKRVGECELRKILLPSRVPFPLHNAREHGSTP